MKGFVGLRVCRVRRILQDDVSVLRGLGTWCFVLRVWGGFVVQGCGV